jgi:hypothetical protein
VQTTGDKKERVTIASCFDGVAVYYQGKEAVELPWKDIVKISYHRNILTIKHRGTKVE